MWGAWRKEEGGVGTGVSGEPREGREPSCEEGLCALDRG